MKTHSVWDCIIRIELCRSENGGWVARGNALSIAVSSPPRDLITMLHYFVIRIPNHLGKD